MADTKVSGLSVVAAFAATQEFPVNDSGISKKITGAQLQAAFPQGTLGYVPATGNQGAITNVETDLTTLTLTPTTVATRRYRISAGCTVASTVADDVAALWLTDASNTHLQVCQRALRVATVVDSFLLDFTHVPGAGARTYKLRLVRANGTGTLTMTAGGTFPAWLRIEDIGI